MADPIHIPGDGGAVENHPPIRSQVQHPFHGTATAPDHKPIHGLVHTLDAAHGRWRITTTGPGRLAVVARAVVIPGRLVLGTDGLQRVLNHHEPADFDDGGQNGRVCIRTLPAIDFDAQDRQEADHGAMVLFLRIPLVQQRDEQIQTRLRQWL